MAKLMCSRYMLSQVQLCSVFESEGGVAPSTFSRVQTSGRTQLALPPKEYVERHQSR